MTAPMPNAVLAYRVLDHIDADPASWNQKYWACGTGHCYGGWAIALSGGKLAHTEDGYVGVVDAPDPDLIGLDACDAANRVLGLHAGTDTAEVNGWPRWLYDASNSRDTLGTLVDAIFGPRPEVRRG